MQSETSRYPTTLFAPSPTQEPVSGRWFEGQVEAIDRLRAMVPGAVLRGRVGSGKTLVAISHARDEWYLGRLSSILIIVPSILLLKWARELEMWWPQTKGRITICNTKTKEYTLPTKGLVVVLTTYHYATEKASLFKDRVWDMRICDEAHALKNPKTRRSKAICGGFDPKRKAHILANKLIYLTATEIAVGAMELWVMYRSLGALNLPYTEFCRQYVLVDYWKKPQGVHNEEDLRDRIDPHRVDIPNDLAPERLVLRDIPIKAKDITDRDLDFINSMWDEEKEMISVNPQDKEEYHRVIQNIGLAKVPVAAQLYKEMLAMGYTPIVFYLHRAVGEALQSTLGDKAPPRLDGTVDPQRRARMVEEFQGGKSEKGLLCGIRAMGEGIDLTRANALIMVELDYTPPRNRQALGRVDRHGQEATTIPVQMLLLENSLDDKVRAVLSRRQEIINKLEGDRNV